MYDSFIDGLVLYSIQNEGEFRHIGKGHDDNPPGRGSGLHPYGSGKRPFQHDPAARAKWLKEKNASSGSAKPSKAGRPQGSEPQKASRTNSHPNATTKEVFSKCHVFQTAYGKDPKVTARMDKAAKIGMEARARTDKNFGDFMNPDGSINSDYMENFLVEGDYGFPMLADLIGQGYSAKQCKAMVKEFARFPKDDEPSSEQRDALIEISSYKKLDEYIDNCEKVYKEQMAAKNKKR